MYNRVQNGTKWYQKGFQKVFFDIFVMKIQMRLFCGFQTLCLQLFLRTYVKVHSRCECVTNFCQNLTNVIRFVLSTAHVSKSFPYLYLEFFVFKGGVIIVKAFDNDTWGSIIRGVYCRILRRGGPDERTGWWWVITFSYV